MEIVSIRDYEFGIEHSWQVQKILKSITELFGNQTWVTIVSELGTFRPELFFWFRKSSKGFHLYWVNIFQSKLTFSMQKSCIDNIYGSWELPRSYSGNWWQLEYPKKVTLFPEHLGNVLKRDKEEIHIGSSNNPAKWAPVVALYFIYYQLALMAGGSGRVGFKMFYGQILRALIEGYGWLLLYNFPRYGSILFYLWPG